jgi:hypothetical protein
MICRPGRKDDLIGLHQDFFLAQNGTVLLQSTKNLVTIKSELPELDSFNCKKGLIWFWIKKYVSGSDQPQKLFSIIFLI